MKAIWVVLGIVVFVALMMWGNYNSLVGKRQNVNVAWANVQSVYQRRLDLVNQTLPVVTAGAAQELAVYKTLRDQAAALGKAFPMNSAGQPVAPTSDAEASRLQQQVAGFNQALVQFTAYAASNPQIRSTELYQSFISQIEGSENRINVARRDYNAAVQDYKVSTQMFPGNIFAGILGFSPSEFAYFQADAGADKAPVIAFPTPDTSR